MAAFAPWTDWDLSAAGQLVKRYRDYVALRIGDALLTSLNTTAKTSLVAAINEINTALGVAGNVYDDQLVYATIAVADTGGGGTDAALTLQLNKSEDGTTAIGSARAVLIHATNTQYSLDSNENVTFGTATIGLIIASGVGWALVLTSAAGAFACTASNSSDEEVFFSANSAIGGVASAGQRCAVIGSNSDSATWSA